MEKLYEGAVRVHARALTTSTDVRDRLAGRIDWRDERGDITPRIIGIAMMAALALAVLGIVTTKVTSKANAISLD